MTNNSSVNGNGNINPNSSSANFAEKQKQKVQLQSLEAQLKHDVDATFFQDPDHFRTLPCVIDILGAQLLESDAMSQGGENSNGNSNAHHAGGLSYMNNNPAYGSLKKQQQSVEEAIEHLSLVHYRDLNASVVAVGHVSKRFGEAVGQVKGLRAQVQEIREQLANASVGNTNNGMNVIAESADEEEDEDNAGRGSGNGNTRIMSMSRGGTNGVVGGKSLRELWLQKLECEAVLSLLAKLDIIREAPGAFDALVHSHPCRIGAAVVLLSEAIKTMFDDNTSTSSTTLAQIQALHKIMEQLMTRKQKAEEIVWETLQDVLYLRTGNYPKHNHNNTLTNKSNGSIDPMNPTLISVDLNSKSGGLSLDSKRREYGGRQNTSRNIPSQQNTRRHQYVSTYNQRADDSDDDGDDDSDEDGDDESRSRYSSDDVTNKSGGQMSADQRSAQRSKASKNKIKGRHMVRQNMNIAGSNGGGGVDPSNIFANFHGHKGPLLPRAMVESELDLEADELRCLETFSLSNGPKSQKDHNVAYSSFSSDATLILPRYTDPILGLRILIEALAKMGRLDDVERCLSENIDRELRRIAQLEQAKTLARLEKRRNKVPGGSGGQNGASTTRRNVALLGFEAAEEKLKSFRGHLKSLLTSFGSVKLRLNYLAQILRYRVTSDPSIVCPSYTKASALHSVLVAADVIMQREVKSFLHGCLNEDEKLESAFQTMRMAASSLSSNRNSRNGGGNNMSSNASTTQSSERGIFSLGIINDASLASSIREKYAQNLSLASRSSVMRMSAEEYVKQILCPRTGVAPQIRHALTFRKAIAAWSKEIGDLKVGLSLVTGEDTSTPEYNATTEETAIAYVDNVIQNTLLPMMHAAADNGTITALERPDAFEPITGVGIYNTSVKGKKLKVEMCAACQGLYSSTGPLFSALPKLPRGGVMYTDLVANLEHAILTFLSRVKQRVSELCDGKKAFQLLEDKTSRHPTRLSGDLESRKPFTQLVNSYFGDGSLGLGSNVDTGSSRSNISPIAPSNTDTKSKSILDTEGKSIGASTKSGYEQVSELQREQESFELEISHMLEILNFTDPRYGGLFKLGAEEEFLKAVSLSHSLLKLASQLERRLMPKKNTWGKSLTAPRTLRESIKNIRMHGIRLAKFCRVEVLLQTVQRMSTIYQSSSLSAKDAVRLPTSVNSLGEYLASISDQMREYGGNKIAAYALSSLEQYVPLFLMETVRLVTLGDGLPKGFKITLNGVESLDRCCSVLYRDLKSATGFDNSFWDDDVAADAFERAASYVALMELDMDELASYWRNNRNEFTDDDYRIMFSMNGPRRRGDLQRYVSLKERLADRR